MGSFLFHGQGKDVHSLNSPSRLLGAFLFHYHANEWGAYDLSKCEVVHVLLTHSTEVLGMFWLGMLTGFALAYGLVFALIFSLGK